MTTTPQDANEREELATSLLTIVSQLPFVERGRTLTSDMYPALVDSILADRKSQKAALLGSLLDEGPKDLEPDNYDDGYAEGWNDAHKKWRELIQAQQQEKK